MCLTTYNMKQIFNMYFRALCVFVIATFLVSCNKSTGRTLTSATGSIYECLVVMNDAPLTQEQRNEIAKLNLVNEASGYTKPIANLYDLVEGPLSADSESPAGWDLTGP